MTSVRTYLRQWSALAEWIRRGVGGCEAIMRSPMPDGLSRTRLLATYLRLKLGPAAQLAARRSRSGPERLLGWRVHYSSYWWLVFLFEEVFAQRVYDVGSLPPRARIVDCGANIGISVLFFKTLHPDARVVAFEPDAAAYALLRRNVEDNGLRDVELHNAAVGARDGTLTLYSSADIPASPQAGGVARPGMTEARDVPMIALSGALADVALLKLDIEGAEHDVVAELAASGALQRVDRLVIEYHHHLSPGDDALGRLLGTLERADFGYQLLTVDQPPKPFCRDEFQDVIIRAYRRWESDRVVSAKRSAAPPVDRA
jgi:FkbM family methyltransferase